MKKYPKLFSEINTFLDLLSEDKSAYFHSISTNLKKSLLNLYYYYTENE